MKDLFPDDPEMHARLDAIKEADEPTKIGEVDPDGFKQWASALHTSKMIDELIEKTREDDLPISPEAAAETRGFLKMLKIIAGQGGNPPL